MVGSARLVEYSDMLLEKTWRWFGSQDSIKLSYLKQIGVEGIVTSLHHLPAGVVWPVDEIDKVKQEIEKYGMQWRVVESLPVAEGIKINSNDAPRLIENYQQSIHNLGICGIKTVCYNFMPVLDWARTDLHYRNTNGGESMLFDYPTFAAFDIYILKRDNAKNDYSEEIQQKAELIFNQLSDSQCEELAYNIIIETQAFIHGVVNNRDDYKKQFLNYLKTYDCIDKDQLRLNLSSFLQKVVPAAEESGVNLCIHPDDPPFPLLGLPRIASTAEDLRWILNQVDSVANGLTFCTGSLSVCPTNDLTQMAQEFASRIHFVHLRNTVVFSDHSFYESGQLTGCVDMVSIVRILLEEQYRRERLGRTDIRIPFRPDHGIKILDDFNRKANPGYPLIGRLKGLAEIDGLQTAIENSLFHNKKVD